MIGLAHGFWNYENVAEHNGGIQLEPFQRLKGNFYCKLGGLDHLEKPVSLFEGPVFGQVPACLPHDPDGWPSLVSAA